MVRRDGAAALAELTDEVRAALADGSLLDPRCGRCGGSLGLALPILLATTDSEPAVVFSPPDGAELDLGVAGSLLLTLRERRRGRPSELAVVPRAALRNGRVTPARYAIPPELWDRPPPPPFSPPGPERLRSAWDELVNSLDIQHRPAMVLRQLASSHVRRYQALGEPDSLTAARAAAERALRAGGTPRERSQSLHVRASGQ